MKRVVMKIAAIAIVLAVPLVAWACGDDEGDNGDGTGNNATVTVVAENTEFTPGEIAVNSGQEVTLDLENRDAFEHDLQVDGLDVEVIEGGTDRPEHGGEHGSDAGVLAVHTGGNEKASITFMASTPGTYEFYCTIPGHKESGMVGTLIVESP
jgi:uncharacterized cupredoxin-like copper-binding protein